jgi:hypothetical protein
MEFFRLRILVVDHPYAASVLTFREVAHFSMMGVFAVRARVEPIDYRFQI